MASLTHVYLHSTWAVDERKPLIHQWLRPGLADYIKRRCEYHNCSPFAIGIVSDHVHLLVRFRLTMPICDFAKDIKGASSRYMNTECSLLEVFRWQTGYAVFSVSHELLDEKIRYVRRQEH